MKNLILLLFFCASLLTAANYKKSFTFYNQRVSVSITISDFILSHYEAINNYDFFSDQIIAYCGSAKAAIELSKNNPLLYEEKYFEIFGKVFPGDSAIKQLNRQLMDLAEKNDWDLAELIVAFVRSLDFDHDKLNKLIAVLDEGKDDVAMGSKDTKTRWPVQTFCAGKGTCEDLSVFCYFLLKEAGYAAAIVRTKGKYKHMTCSVGQYVFDLTGENNIKEGLHPQYTSLTFLMKVSGKLLSYRTIN